MPHLNQTDDFRHGVIVVVAARWLLAVAGLLFLLYRPASTLELAAGTLGVLAIAAVNFWIHTRLLTRQPLEPAWLYAATAADLTVITWLVAVQGGLAGNAFVFYYPAMLAFSLVFPRAVTILFTASALSVYAVLCLTEHVDERVLVARVLSLAAVAFLGSRYQQVEAHRRARRAELAIATPASSPRLEAEEDVFYGQIVCITARWFVIAGAVFLALWRVTDLTQMQRHLIPLLVLVAANFFLHGRYLMGLPANRLLLELASVLDLAVITAILLVVAPDGARGLRNPFFVFYYPVVLAFALVFLRRLTLVYVGALSVLYGLVCLRTPPGVHWNGDEETLAIRLVTLLGTALLGTLYWRLVRARRRGEVL